MSTLFVCGAGNPAGVRLAINVNRAEKNWERIVVLDDNPELLHSKMLDCKVIGGFGELAHANKDTDHVVNLVAAKTTGRWKVRSLVKEYGIPFARLIHPAVDTLGVSFGGDDITVYENATLGAGSYMGEACIVFMNAVLGHGAHMDTCSILGPGAVLRPPLAPIPPWWETYQTAPRPWGFPLKSSPWRVQRPSPFQHLPPRIRN